MKSRSPKLFFTLCFVATTLTCGDVFSADTDILAQRGEGIITQKQFEARANKIPENARRATLRDGGRLRNVLNSMLLRAQLAEDARAAGFDQQQIVIERMKLAAQEELAEAWMAHYVKQQHSQADFEQLAREKYELNKEDIMSEPKIDVSHILISTDNRSVEDAKNLADTISIELTENPDEFNELVKKHSDDLSASANKGKFHGVKKGDMVKEFESMAFSLSEGEISGPVRTQYGYHIIRLDKHYPSTRLDFETVKPQLIAQERKLHEDRIKNVYLNSLSNLDVEMSEESLKEMVRRVFGEDYVETQVDGDVIE